MAESRVVRINRSLYVLIPAEEARRLRLQAGQRVDVDVRPTGATATELLALKGKYPGQFADVSDEDLWGEDA